MNSKFDDAGDIEVQIRVNTQQRTPCVLVLDVSSSMQSPKHMPGITALNKGLIEFEKALKSDEMVIDRVVIEVITFGSTAQIKSTWTDASEFSPPRLEASGLTAMGEAMEMALAEIEQLKVAFRTEGITYTRPWIFLITDGGPTDSSWRDVAAKVRHAVEEKKVIVWPIATPSADVGPLREFGGPNADVYRVETADFGALFQWLSVSLGVVSRSRVGDAVQLEAPPGPIVQV